MDISERKLPGEKRTKRKKKPTLRFELDLPDSTDTSCPEYSYVDLLRQNLKDRESKGQNDPLCQNLLEEEEEKERNEAKAIAEYFEIKYGETAAGHKRKRKDKIRDLVGAGYGYDENDPFVDDSEAYDEIVPASLTTQHGGFYINTGKLNFRTVSDESDTGSTSSDDSVPLSHHISKKKKKHSNLLDSDESESEFQKDELAKKKKKKLKQSKDPEKKRRKMSLNGKDKVAGLKQRAKKIKKPTSLAQKLVAKAKAQKMMNASSAHTSNGAVPQFRKSLSDESFNKSKSGELGKLENKDLAEVAKRMTKNLMSVGSSGMDPNNGQRMENGFGNNSNSTSSKNTPTVNHELPPNLPQNLGDKIESLKKIAKSTEDAGKMKFFSSDVNKILLGIDESAQVLRNKERVGMYQHIAQHLPCSKDTLLKRIKKLQEDDSDQQLKGPIQRLKAGVDAVMTSQIEAYVLECDAKSEKFPDKSLAIAAASTDEDDEGEEKSTDTSGEKGKRTYAPRRKFKWDDKLRKLLCDVVSVKMNIYDRFKPRDKQSAEEYLKAFLESTIKPLWPKPWMQTRVLFRESRSVHERFTNIVPKQKKAGSNKKVLSVGKDGAAPRLDVTASTSAMNDNKTSKKQLAFDTPTSKTVSQLNVKPSMYGESSHTKKNGASGMIDLSTSGGFELMAAIEGDDFSPTRKTDSQKFGTSHSSPQDRIGAWKAKSSSSANLQKNSPKPKTPQTAPTIPETSSVERKTDSKVPKRQSNITHTPTHAMDPKIAQDYASDFVNLMMSSGGLPHTAAGYYGMPGVSSYDAISKILGLRTDDIMPKPQSSKPQASDEKFQFKITTSPNSKSDNRSHSQGGFQILDPSRKRLPTVMDSSWTGQGIVQPQNKTDKSHGFSQKIPARSVPSFSDGSSVGHSSAHASPQRLNFLTPSSDSSKFAPQRQRKVAETVVSDRSNREGSSKIIKLASPATKNPKQSPPLTISLSKQHLHHQHLSALPKSPVPPKETANHGGMPSMISSVAGQYQTHGLGNSFSAAFTSPLASPYSSASKFQAPVGPAHQYPATSMPTHPFASPSFSLYPQVKLADIKGSADASKQSAANHGNQTR